MPKYLKLCKEDLKGGDANWYSKAALTGINSLLLRFNLYYENRPNSARRSSTKGMDVPGSDTYNKKSSTYKDNLCFNPPLSMPAIALDLTATARRSVAIVNNSGESGQPCLVPCHDYNRNTLDIYCLFLIQAMGDMYKAMNYSEKPNLQISV